MRAPLTAEGFQIPGDPGELRWLAAQLETQADGLVAVAMEIGDIRAEGWTGLAADAFAAVLRAQPDRFERAGGAFTTAAAAVRLYADALDDAQSVVAAASWLGAADPQPADANLAAALIAAAGQDLDAAGAMAAAVLHALASEAPRSESLLRRVTGDAFDVVALPAHVAVGLGVGAKSMTAGIYALGKAQALESPVVALVDHAAWKRMNDQINAASQAIVRQPARFLDSTGKNLLAWHEWSKDPGQALGETLAMAAAGVFTDGAGDAADGLDAAGDAVRSADMVESARPADDRSPSPSGSKVSLEQARAAAERNGLDLSNVDLMYEAPDASGYRPSGFGRTAFTWDDTPFQNADGKFEMTLQDRALTSEEEAVATIAHEWAHLYLVGPADHAAAEAFAERVVQGYQP